MCYQVFKKTIKKNHKLKARGEENTTFYLSLAHNKCKKTVFLLRFLLPRGIYAPPFAGRDRDLSPEQHLPGDSCYGGLARAQQSRDPSCAGPGATLAPAVLPASCSRTTVVSPRGLRICCGESSRARPSS